MKCANCSADALHIYNPKPLQPTAYCADHLPTFLRQAAKAGLLDTAETFEAVKASAFSKVKSRRKKTPDVVVETVTPDPVAEEPVDAAPVEEPASSEA